MGYYTYYHLDVGETLEEAKAGYSNVSIEARREMAIALYTEICDWYSESELPIIKERIIESHDPLNYELEFESIKWYSHDNDMLELSIRYLNYYFALYGEGEDRGDDWIAYYHNGKYQICTGRIVYDTPNETLFI